MSTKFATRDVSLAVFAVIAMTSAVTVPQLSTAAEKAATKVAGTYVTGDFHNHSTCSDGSLSMKKLIDKSVKTFGLDWFVQADHGGSSARNCTLSEDPFEPVPSALGAFALLVLFESDAAAASGKGMTAGALVGAGSAKTASVAVSALTAEVLAMAGVLIGFAGLWVFRVFHVSLI